MTLAMVIEQYEAAHVGGDRRRRQRLELARGKLGHAERQEHLPDRRGGPGPAAPTARGEGPGAAASLASGAAENHPSVITLRIPSWRSISSKPRPT